MLKNILINYIRQKLRNNFIFINEFYLDIKYYFKTKHYFKSNSFKAYKNFNFSYNQNLSLVFFVGIGDVIYGLPTLHKISEILKRKSLKFNAYVERYSSNYSNPAVYELLKSTKLFDSVSYFNGIEVCEYWKYYNWMSIPNLNNTRILPFIYKTTHKTSRIEKVSNQFNIKLPRPIKYPEFYQSKSFVYDFLLRSIRVNKSRNIFIHLETRSGDYKYPYLNDMLNLLLDQNIFNYNIIVFTEDPEHIILDKKFIKQSLNTFKKKIKYIKLKNNSKLIAVNPKNIPLNNQLLLIKDKCDVIISINSYLWAVGNMFNKSLIGIHYLDSYDMNTFAYENSFFITSSVESSKRNTNNILMQEGYHYRRLPQNSFMVEFYPKAILHGIHVSRKLFN